MASDGRHHLDATGAGGATPSRSLARACRWSLVLGFVCFPVPAFALLINMSFETVSGSVALTGAGNTAMMNLGSVSAFEPVNPGVTRTVGASSFTISTRFGVRATHLLPLLSPHYTLRARLQSGSPITWQVDGVTMSTSFATFSASQPYGPAVAHTVAFVVPFSRPAGTVSTVFEVTAIAD